MAFFQDKFLKRKNMEEEETKVLKWDIEMDMEEDDELSKNIKSFKPMLEFSNKGLINSKLEKKKSSNLYHQLTINSSKDKILRSRTAATLKSNNKEIIEVIDENGNIIKINKSMLLINKDNFESCKKNCNFYILKYITFRLLLEI